jgi:hypothetical protein
LGGRWRSRATEPKPFAEQFHVDHGELPGSFLALALVRKIARAASLVGNGVTSPRAIAAALAIPEASPSCL